MEAGSVGTAGGAAGFAGSASVSITGTPVGPVYTASQEFSGGGGGATAAVTGSGGGGGGAGGPTNTGGTGGGSTTTSLGGGGGGASNGGGAASNASTASGTQGGGGGGAGGTSGTPAGGNATAASGDGGGGGFFSAVAAATTTGGAGGNENDWTYDAIQVGTGLTVSSGTGGAGGAGGGGGGNSVNTTGPTTSGGNGGNYGGGGGGSGGTRATTSTRTAGTGASGLIVITYILTTADAWSAADKTTTVALSNSDKTATTSASNAAVRSSTTHLNGPTTGKYYVEFAGNVVGSYSCEIKDTASPLATTSGSTVVNSVTGNIVVGGTASGLSLGVFASGDILCMAWDAGAERIWFRKNSGLWNNNAAADPATGTNGLDVSATYTDNIVVALWLVAFNASASAVTVRTELADLTYTGPSGWTTWMGEPIVGITAWDGAATLAGSGSLSFLANEPDIIMAARATLAGAGALSFLANEPDIIMAARASAACTGTLVADASVVAGGVVQQGSALLAVTAGLAAAATKLSFATSTLAPAGGLTATGFELSPGQALLVPAAALTAAGFKLSPATATLAPTGGLAAAATKLSFATATLVGAGALVANATKRSAASAALASAGTFAADASVVGGATGTLAATEAADTAGGAGAIAQTGSTLQIGENSTANTGTVSTTVTVPADAEIVVVALSAFGGTNYFSGGNFKFTKGGTQVNMTMVAGDSAGTWQTAMGYLALPDTGANKTLSYDWAGTGTSPDTVRNYSITFWKGIDTASPVCDSDGAQSGSFPVTTPTLTAETGDLIVAFCAGFNGAQDGSGTINTWSNLTELVEVAHNSYAEGAWATGSPSGNTTVGASTGGNWSEPAIVAVVLKPAAAGGFSGTVAWAARLQAFEADQYELLLHLDGADGSFSIVDSGGGNHILTAHGAAQIDTAQSVFDGQALLVSSDSDYVSADTGNYAFGTDDFCIDFRVRLLSASAPQMFYDGGSSGPQIFYDGSALKYSGAAERLPALVLPPTRTITSRSRVAQARRDYGRTACKRGARSQTQLITERQAAIRELVPAACHLV